MNSANDILEIMGFAPTQLQLAPYLMTNLVDNRVQEEVIARVLIYSITARTWVPVTIDQLRKDMESELEAHIAAEKTLAINIQRWKTYEKAQNVYNALSFWSFGILRLFFKSPTPPVLQQLPQEPEIYTTIYHSGTRPVLKAISRLTDKGLLRRTIGWNGGPDELTPTRKLAELLRVCSYVV